MKAVPRFFMELERHRNWNTDVWGSIQENIRRMSKKPGRASSPLLKTIQNGNKNENMFFFLDNSELHGIINNIFEKKRKPVWTSARGF